MQLSKPPSKVFRERIKSARKHVIKEIEYWKKSKQDIKSGWGKLNGMARMKRSRIYNWTQENKKTIRLDTLKTRIWTRIPMTFQITAYTI